MKTRACVLHAQEDVRSETLEVGAAGPQQVPISALVPVRPVQN